MKTNSDPELRLAGITTKCKKAPYQVPVLRVYGAVNQLTRAKGGSLSDGSSGMNML